MADEATVAPAATPSAFADVHGHRKDGCYNAISCRLGYFKAKRRHAQLLPG